MRDAGFDFDGNWLSAENIAVQSERGDAGYMDDIYDLHVSLMNSPSHRSNILTADFQVVGIGIEVGEFQYGPTTSLFSVMVTQNFARTGGMPDVDVVSGNVTLDNNGNHWIGSIADDTVQAKGGDDVLIDDDGNDTLDAGAGSDRLRGGGGDDHLVGSFGNDIAEFTGNCDDYAIVIQDGLVTVRQKGGPDGTDTLIDVETLEFADATKTLYTGVTKLTEAELETFVEMYIAYFNRAPAAEGLAYWGTQLKNGMSIEKIAESFFMQPETQQTYPASMPYEAFVEKVFVNVLGRPPAKKGLDYWSDQLESGAVARPTFMLAVINGAKAATGSADDAAYLAEKTMIGTYFSAIKGLMDVSDARHVMSIYDGSDASLAAAKSFVDDAYADTLGHDDAGLTIQILGVADDPFA